MSARISVQRLIRVYGPRRPQSHHLAFMRRICLGLAVMIVLTLAACSSAPERPGGASAARSDAFRTRPPGLPNFVDHSIGREEVSVQAMSLVGVPYRWAGNTPVSGFDCSGLVQYIFARAADVKLPRTTAEISRRGQSIDPDEIAAGDLVFFNTSGRPHSHVGIYVGKLRFVNAPSTGGTVRLDYLTNPYWAKRFDGIRRVATPLRQPPPFDSPTYLASPAPALPSPSPSPAPALTATRVDRNGGTISSADDAMARVQRDRPLTDEDTQWKNVSNMNTARAPLQAPARPDAVDTAADAFEPPPPAAALAAQQARRASGRSVAPPSSPSGVQIMRASTPPRMPPAPTSTNDDPIAGFAAGNQ